MSYKRTSKKGYCFVQTLQYNDPVLFSYEITLKKDNYSEKNIVNYFVNNTFWPNVYYGNFSLKFGDQYASFSYSSSKEAKKSQKRLSQLIDKLIELEFTLREHIETMEDHEEKIKAAKRSIKSRKRS